MSRILVLHGLKLDKGGSLSPLMLDRINTLKKLLVSCAEAELIISGGKTRKKFDSEAEVIFDYLKKNAILAEGIKVFLEDHSKTTAENILEVRKIMGNVIPTNMEVITTQECVPRLKFLYGKLWPETKNKIIYCSGKRESKLLLSLTEKLYLLYEHIDPENKWVGLPVKIFRNG